jgi:SAM-dependent methyltransferase
VTVPASQANAALWRRAYAEGRNDLRYPSDVLVRLGARLLSCERERRILDFGFGTGANLLHFVSQGFEVHGAEVSEHALARTRERLQAAGLAADLRLVGADEPLPYTTGYFDAVYAWQVLYYNDLPGWAATVSKLERVTKPGGLVIFATAAPGDISHLEAESLGHHTYRSRVPGQEGCVVVIPERDALGSLFPGRQIEVGEFGLRFAGVVARFWIVTYRMTSG